MQPGVLDGDGQAEAGTAGGAGAGGVGAPEAVEDPGGLAGLEPHPVVAYGDGDRAARRRQPYDHVPALAVLDGVDHEVAQHALDPSGVRLGDHRLLVAAYDDPAALALGQRFGRLDHPAHDVPQVDGFGGQVGRSGVEAADLQQVGQQ